MSQRRGDETGELLKTWTFSPAAEPTGTSTPALPQPQIVQGGGTYTLGWVRNSVEAQLARVPRWARHLPIALLAVAYAIRFGVLSVHVLDGFHQPAFDMAIPDQGIWLLSRFHNPFVTVMGRQFFGDHTSYILILLVPVYWLYPHTAVLLVVQSIVIAAAAIPIYGIARHLLKNTLLATLVASAYLLNPALQWGNMEQFHVECFEVAFLATALYGAIVWRIRVLFPAIILLLLCKEDAALYAIPLGMWVWLRRDRALGGIIVLMSVLAALINDALVIPALIGVANVHGDRLPFNGVGGSVREFIRHPAQVWSYGVSDKRPRYLWQLAFSAGLVFLLVPEVAAIALLGIGLNVWSTFGYQHQIQYHYSLPIVPILICGSAWAISKIRLSRRRALAVGCVAISSIWACILWGLAPFSDATYPGARWNSGVVAATTEVVQAVPPNAVVSAFEDYVPELDHRTRIYVWPNPFKASYWGTFKQEGQELPFAYTVRYVILPTSLVNTDSTWQQIASQFKPVRFNSVAILYERIDGG